jgi:hypothetical protein
MRAWTTGDRDIPFRYVWVAELQKRGALHYHVAIWLPKRVQLPKFDKQGWWPHGSTQRLIAKNAVGYLMKYLSKISPFHKFPKGVRIHGFGGLTQQARGNRPATSIHPAIPAAGSQGYSGSTAWHNSVRSRLFLPLKPVTVQLPYQLACGVDGMNLYDVLCQINANSCNLAHGTSPFKGFRLTFQKTNLGT